LEGGDIHSLTLFLNILVYVTYSSVSEYTHQKHDATIAGLLRVVASHNANLISHKNLYNMFSDNLWQVLFDQFEGCEEFDDRTYSVVDALFLFLGRPHESINHLNGVIPS
jgi:hypothetical protein